MGGHLYERPGFVAPALMFMSVKFERTVKVYA